jgi:hypothetical protein
VLCAAARLVTEEAAMLMGLGGAHLAAGRVELATESYGRAAGLAEGQGQWQMACQAWLGVGGASLVAGRSASAATAYIAAAGAAYNGGIASLRLLALRMAATCCAQCWQDETGKTTVVREVVHRQLDAAGKVMP